MTGQQGHSQVEPVSDATWSDQLTLADGTMLRPYADGVLLTSTQPCWWFLATMPVQADAIDADVAVTLDVAIVGGTAGICLVGDDNATILVETIAGAGFSGRVTLRQPCFMEGMRCVLRSVDAGNRPLLVRLAPPIWSATRLSS